MVGKKSLMVVLLTCVIVVSGLNTGILSYSEGSPSIDQDRLDNVTSNTSSSVAETLSNVSLDIDTTHNESQLEQEIHKEINDRRQEHGLSALDSDSALAEVARSHSQDMATRGYFEHESPEGADFSDRYRRHGYSCEVTVSGNQYSTGGENIAYRSSTSLETNESELAEFIVDGWMNSTGHRENILRPFWQSEGIGVNISREGDMTTAYATQNFC